MSPWPLSAEADIDIRPLACENRNTGGSRFQFNQIAVCAIGIETPEMLRTLLISSFPPLMKGYTVFINNYYFLTLQDSEQYGDRPEPYRAHEQSLWTIYQISKNPNITIVIVDIDQEIVFESNLAAELAIWIQDTYQQFADQIDAGIPTRHPHPQSWLVRK